MPVSAVRCQEKPFHIKLANRNESIHLLKLKYLSSVCFSLFMASIFLSHISCRCSENNKRRQKKSYTYTSMVLDERIAKGKKDEETCAPTYPNVNISIPEHIAVVVLIILIIIIGVGVAFGKRLHLIHMFLHVWLSAKRKSESANKKIINRPSFCTSSIER